MGVEQDGGWVLVVGWGSMGANNVQDNLTSLPACAVLILI